MDIQYNIQYWIRKKGLHREAVMAKQESSREEDIIGYVEQKQSNENISYEHFRLSFYERIRVGPK